MKYQFKAVQEEWRDEGGLVRSPLGVTFDGTGESVDQVLADFKDWMMAIGFSQNLANDIVYSPYSIESFINETKKGKK